MKVLVTGSAGFIGANLVLRLLETESPIDIVGLDSVNDYYTVVQQRIPRVSITL